MRDRLSPLGALLPVRYDKDPSGQVSLTSEGGVRSTQPTRDAEWQRDFEVNVLGPFLLLGAVIPRMLENQRGRVIHIGSRSAQRKRFTNHFLALGLYCSQSESTPAHFRIIETLGSLKHSWFCIAE